MNSCKITVLLLQSGITIRVNALMLETSYTNTGFLFVHESKFGTSWRNSQSWVFITLTWVLAKPYLVNPKFGSCFWPILIQVLQKLAILTWVFRKFGWVLPKSWVIFDLSFAIFAQKKPGVISKFLVCIFSIKEKYSL